MSNPFAARLGPDGLCIFLFHGVVERRAHTIRNYNRKHLEAAEFRAILEAALGRGPCLSMDQVVEHHLSRTPFPLRSFAITFDDGFENNWSVARPILEELGLPAMVYVTTGFAEDNRMAWIDRIEWAVEQRPRGRLTLPWREAPAAYDGVAESIALLDEIRQRVKRDPRLDPDAVASDLQRQCGLPETWSGDDPLDRKLTWAQVRDMAAHPLFSVGGHSHRHSVLALLPPARLEEEVGMSIRLLRERAGVVSRHYAYPEGLPYAYSAEVIGVLRGHGIVCCPTAEDGLNTPDTDLFHLKRLLVM